MKLRAAIKWNEVKCYVMYYVLRKRSAFMYCALHCKRGHVHCMYGTHRENDDWSRSSSLRQARTSLSETQSESSRVASRALR